MVKAFVEIGDLLLALERAGLEGKVSDLRLFPTTMEDCRAPCPWGEQRPWTDMLTSSSAQIMSWIGMALSPRV